MHAWPSRTVEHRAPIDGEGTTQHFAEMGARFIGRKRREKSKTASIDTDNGNLLARRFARHPEERAIAADHAARIKSLQESRRQRIAGGQLERYTSRTGHCGEFTRQRRCAFLVF